MPTPARSVRWLVPVVLLIAWLGIGGGLGPYAGKLGEVATNDQAAFLPQNAESTQVIDAQKAFQQNETLPVILVWTSAEKDTPVDDGQREAATGALASLAGSDGVVGTPSPALPSKDGLALQGIVQLSPDLGDELPAVLEEVDKAGASVSGTTVQLAGPAASQADLSDAFAGIDGLLLGVALITVLVILLLVYRSVLLPFVIILGAVFALGLSCAIVYVLADHDIVRVDGQVQGILSILVIGAATDYALLLTARFREELAVHGDRFAAMRVALRESFGPITASAATVAAGLLALLLSDLTNNRALGPVGAIGIVCSVLSALTFLPAALVLLGRTAYWPAKPKPADDKVTGGHGIWHKVAALVDRAPRRVWAITLAALIACAAFAPTLTSKGVPLDEIFVNDAPSVAAQQTLSEHFPGGSGNPAVIIASSDRLPEVTGAAERDRRGRLRRTGERERPAGRRTLVVDGKVRIDATLEDAADSDGAKETVAALRTAVHAVPGSDALVGGYTAQQYDTQRTAEDDRTLIVPVVLAIILVILVFLLRSLLMPVLLVATVALNFLATLGISSLVFTHVFGFSGTDSSVPLYGFVFLVALGVDYNIFLMSRVREESLRHGTREGILRGLTTTGGVITSAGVVLAATFAALGVIPLAFLLQIAFIVAFGVLLDTLVVRSLLVPALVRDIGAEGVVAGGAEPREVLRTREEVSRAPQCVPGRPARVPVGGERPDHEDVQGDDDHRPEGRVRQEEEVREEVQGGEDDAGHPRPARPLEHSRPGDGDTDAEHQVDPAPAGEADPVDVLADIAVDVPVGQGRDALQGRDDALAEHQDPGEEHAAGHPEAVRVGRGSAPDRTVAALPRRLALTWPRPGPCPKPAGPAGSVGSAARDGSGAREGSSLIRTSPAADPPAPSPACRPPRRPRPRCRRRPARPSRGGRRHGRWRGPRSSARGRPDRWPRR